jgi:hypothetical protein
MYWSIENSLNYSKKKDVPINKHKEKNILDMLVINFLTWMAQQGIDGYTITVYDLLQYISKKIQQQEEKTPKKQVTEEEKEVNYIMNYIEEYYEKEYEDAAKELIKAVKKEINFIEITSAELVLNNLVHVFKKYKLDINLFNKVTDPNENFTFLVFLPEKSVEGKYISRTVRVYVPKANKSTEIIHLVFLIKNFHNLVSVFYKKTTNNKIEMNLSFKIYSNHFKELIKYFSQFFDAKFNLQDYFYNKEDNIPQIFMETFYSFSKEKINCNFKKLTIQDFMYILFAILIHKENLTQDDLNKLKEFCFGLNETKVKGLISNLR